MNIYIYGFVSCWHPDIQSFRTGFLLERPSLGYLVAPVRPKPWVPSMICAKCRRLKLQPELLGVAFICSW